MFCKHHFLTTRDIEMVTLNIEKEDPKEDVRSLHPTRISKTEISRMADIARREQVTIELEFGGKIVRVSPLSKAAYAGTDSGRRGGVVL